MKYSSVVDIRLPMFKVLPSWQPAYYKEWQPDLLDVSHISGTPGQAGAKHLLGFDSTRGRQNVLETLVASELPGRFVALYQGDDTEYRMQTHFSVIDDNHCRFTCEVRYTRVGGAKQVVRSWLWPARFKTATVNWQRSFKKYVEKLNR